jgi:hypothetical protein
MASSKAIRVKVVVQQANLQRHSESDLRAKVNTSMANKKPSIPAGFVFKRLEARHARRLKALKRSA